VGNLQQSGIREFYMKVWDGTSPTRPDPLVRKSPDGVDWKTVTDELRKVQTFVVNLADNAKEMPNIVEEVKRRARQINNLKAQISSLTAPEDVIKRVTKMGEELEEMRGIYAHAGEVLQTVSLLQRQLLNLSARIDDHIDENKTKRLAFENKVVNWQRDNERGVNERLDKLEKTSGAIALALSIKIYGEE
jgi:flagellar biosynthesis chaperone FliJ